MGPEQPKPTRKRNRKRKRRVVSDSSSSEEDSSSSSSDASESTPNKTVTIPVRQPKSIRSEHADAENEGEASSSSSDESKDDSDSDEDDVDMSVPSSRPAARPEPPSRRDSSSPPLNVDIPPFIPPNTPESEQALKDKFRKFWMASIADGFKDDLEEIRKEPNLGSSRLALLIESLASGADVFSSSSSGGCVNEMEVVLDQLP